MKKLEFPLKPKTFRLHPDTIATLNAMPDRHDWIRNLITDALAQQKSA